MAILKFINFSQFDLWDIKRYSQSAITSRFPIILLGDYIEEKSKRVKLFDFPEKEFGILGVNNKTGIFDAYLEKGENINQSYKVVEDDYLAYNPYRINVGSIGRKTNKHKNNYISPAYVVFECSENLSSEFLYRMFRTNTFNQIIKNNTTGSVRQNLKFDTLAAIKIPLPPLQEQNRIVSNYNQKTKLANQQQKEAKQLEQEIENYLFEVLAIKKLEQKETKKGLQFISFEDIDRWGVDYLGKLSKIETRFKGKFNLIKLRDFIESYQYGLSEKSSKEVIGFPMLRMNNINNSYLNVDKLKYIKIDDTIFQKYKLYKGDLLFNRTNSKELVGKTAVFNLDEDFTFASYLIKVVIDKSKANVEYINDLFNTSILKYQKNLISRQITGQANINAQEMQDFLFPLPPLEIQNEIVEYISVIKDKIKDLRTQSAQNKALALEEFENELFN